MISSAHDFALAYRKNSSFPIPYSPFLIPHSIICNVCVVRFGVLKLV